MSDQPLFAWADGAQPYPNNPGFKARATSQEAAQSIKPRATILREQVLELYQAGHHFAADQCVDALHQLDQYRHIDRHAFKLSVRPRLSELAAEGLIVETPHRYTNDSGHSAAKWRLATPEEGVRLRAEWRARKQRNGGQP